jgi:hypothetical protein
MLIATSMIPCRRTSYESTRILARAKQPAKSLLAPAKRQENVSTCGREFLDIS